MGSKAKYSATTRGICVTVSRPICRSKNPRPKIAAHVWAYHVTTENRWLGDRATAAPPLAVLLMHAVACMKCQARAKDLASSAGSNPAKLSNTPRHATLTSSGIMSGSYQMENEQGESFDIEIPGFLARQSPSASAVELKDRIPRITSRAAWPARSERPRPDRRARGAADSGLSSRP